MTRLAIKNRMAPDKTISNRRMPKRMFLGCPIWLLSDWSRQVPGGYRFVLRAPRLGPPGLPMSPSRIPSLARPGIRARAKPKPVLLCAPRGMDQLAEILVGSNQHSIIHQADGQDLRVHKSRRFLADRSDRMPFSQRPHDLHLDALVSDDLQRVAGSRG